MKRLAIFDLDGTLLDTIADLAAATNHTLSQFGYPTHTTDEYRFFVGNGINKLFERALPEGEKSQQNVLKIRGSFIPLASNKYQEATTKLIRQYFPSVRFTAVFGQREGVPSKPDPQVINEIIRLANVKKEETVYAGDSCVDMQTGKNAGVTTIGVSWGFRPRAELEAYSPDLIADRCEDILRFLQQE